MNPTPELTPLLKKLRLSGLAETLEQRNREAIERKLAYTEFLTLLIQDEIARRDQQKLELRLRRAGFHGSKTLESFDFDFNPKVPREMIWDLATCRFIEEKACVLIAGPCGTGKSHLAQALGGSYKKRFNKLARIDLLVLDDYGLKPLKSPEDEDLHDLIAERYERHPTMVTSNLDFAEWGEAFPNRLLGAATLDRLRHGAYRVVLEGKSYRRPRS